MKKNSGTIRWIELKFRPKRRRKENIKLSAKELKELAALEDKGGKSKIDDTK